MVATIYAVSGILRMAGTASDRPGLRVVGETTVTALAGISSRDPGLFSVRDTFRVFSFDPGKSFYFNKNIELAGKLAPYHKKNKEK